MLAGQEARLPVFSLDIYGIMPYSYGFPPYLLYGNVKAAQLENERLTNAELSVMELLWDAEQLTARQIREQLYGDSEKAQHGTVQRLLQSLEEKRFVNRDRSLGVQLFSAVVGREQYGGAQLETLAQKLTGGSIAPLLTHLLDEKKLGKAEIKRLRKLLEEAQKRG